MIAVLQRVSEASVAIGGATVASIGAGLLVLVAVERGDREPQAVRMAERLLAYRVFSDPAGRMNLSVRDVGGGVLLVPQFTLAADTDRGNRASFGHAADPADGERLFGVLVDTARRHHEPLAVGRFGAEMDVALINHGPVTFRLRVRPAP